MAEKGHIASHHKAPPIVRGMESRVYSSQGTSAREKIRYHAGPQMRVAVRLIRHDDQLVGHLAHHFSNPAYEGLSSDREQGLVNTHASAFSSS